MPQDRGTRGARRPSGPVVAIENVRVYRSPDEPPIEGASLVLRSGRIEAVGRNVRVPPGAEKLAFPDAVVTAGFWNSHVHFTEPRWQDAAQAAPDELAAGLREMLTSRGFTTAVDTGSDPRTTLPLRARVASGAVAGPTILTAGSSIFPPNGIPYYVRNSLPEEVLPFVPQPASPAAARRTVEEMIAAGADLIKIFTGSWVERGRVTNMPLPIARAATAAAHERARLVFTHASNLAGVRVAQRASVDVLAHPPDATSGVDDALLQGLVAQRMSMIPTLKMFGTVAGADPEYLRPIHAVVRRFREFGGELLFGTDVGFMSDYSTEEEFRALVDCGLDGRAILRSLTTTPAARMGFAHDRGTIAPALRADLVVLDGDPVEDPERFARIRATIVSGRVVYDRG